MSSPPFFKEGSAPRRPDTKWKIEQKILGAVIDGPGGNSVWGAITGTLSNQADLQTALDAKVTDGQATVNLPLNSAPVAYTQPSLAFDTEYTNGPSRAFLGVILRCEATSGGGEAEIDLQVKVGGVYSTVTKVVIDGATIHAQACTILSPGQQFKIVNVSNPDGGNAINATQLIPI